MFAHGETVILHRKTIVSDPDSFYQDEEEVVEDIPLDNAGLFFDKSSEQYTDGNGRVITNLTVKLGKSVSITSQDEMTVRGTRYTVDGDSSGDQINPLTGTFFGCTIQLRGVNG